MANNIGGNSWSSLREGLWYVSSSDEENRGNSREAEVDSSSEEDLFGVLDGLGLDSDKQVNAYEAPTEEGGTFRQVTTRLSTHDRVAACWEGVDNAFPCHNQSSQGSELWRGPVFSGPPQAEKEFLDLENLWEEFRVGQSKTSPGLKLSRDKEQSQEQKSLSKFKQELMRSYTDSCNTDSCNTESCMLRLKKINEYRERVNSWAEIVRNSAPDIDLNESWFDFCLNEICVCVDETEGELFQEWLVKVREETKTTPNLERLWKDWGEYVSSARFEKDLEGFAETLLEGYIIYCESTLQIDTGTNLDIREEYHKILEVWKDIVRELRQEASEKNSDVDLREEWINFCFESTWGAEFKNENEVYEKPDLQRKFQIWEQLMRKMIDEENAIPNLRELTNYWRGWLQEERFLSPEEAEEADLERALALSLREQQLEEERMREEAGGASSSGVGFPPSNFREAGIEEAEETDVDLERVLAFSREEERRREEERYYEKVGGASSSGVHLSPPHFHEVDAPSHKMSKNEEEELAQAIKLSLMVEQQEAQVEKETAFSDGAQSPRSRKAEGEAMIVQLRMGGGLPEKEEDREIRAICMKYGLNPDNYIFKPMN